MLFYNRYEHAQYRRKPLKTRCIGNILLIAYIGLGGCSSVEVTPEALLKEVLPGVYMSNDPAQFSFPTSGYTVYIVGETYGNRETKLIFRTRLQTLYQAAGLRDIILEEDQGYETEANAYIQGLKDELPTGLCLRMDILTQIREFNASLPAGEKVRVHLVDVDSPFPIIYKHLVELHKQTGASGERIQIPDLEEFQVLRSASMFELINELRNVAKDQPDILNGLDTVYWSIRWHFLGNRMDIGLPVGPRRTFFPMREDIITQNIQHLVTQLDGKPVLAFFGAAHGMKNTVSVNLPVFGFKSWAQRLMEAGVRVYSMLIDGISGAGYWQGESFSYGKGVGEYQLEDGSSLFSLFIAHSEMKIIYIDLRREENANLQLVPEFPDVPASQVYDGLILFQEFTPMENACPS
jgi:hypothetical protein